MIVFPIAGSGQRITFTDAVLDHFRKHSQTRKWRAEAGGQLFARFELPDIIIEEATGPGFCDLRTRFPFAPIERPNRGKSIIDTSEACISLVTGILIPKTFPSRPTSTFPACRKQSRNLSIV